MAGQNFVVQNGLTVGPLTIDAATGSITTSGTVSIEGGLGTSSISKNNSSLTIIDTGATGSRMDFTIDGDVTSFIDINGLTSSPDGTATAFLTAAGLTDDIFLATKSVNSFVQLAIHNPNNGTSASTDFIAYADTGDNTRGYVDLGIASSTFDDVAFGSTKAGDSYLFASAPAGTGGNLVLATENGTFGDIVFAAGGFMAGTEQGRFKTGDGLYLTGNLIANGGTIYQGPLAKEFEAGAELTDSTIILTDDINGFAQAALHNNNTGISASADYIAYADTGDNLRGYIDMGIASTLFADTAYGITKGGDGYIFVSAPAYAGNAAATGGNLVLATADGAFGDIVFAAGGFIDGTEQGRFVYSDGLYVTGNIYTTDGQLFQGPDAQPLLTSSNVSSALSSTINSSATTIPVGSTAGFPNHGSLHIQDELMYYTGKTSNSFTNVTRGTSGTTAASHNSGVLAYQSFAGLSGTSAVFSGNEDGFVQVALKNINSGSSASTDIIAYASNGDNDSGWIDMGITSETFNDVTYGITGPDDGYIFMAAPDGTVGDGELHIATNDAGATNDIVFSTNGFSTGNERMRIVGKGRAGKPAGVEIYIPTTSTSTSTGALRVQGGVGIQGNLFVGGNFNLTGNITIGGTGSTTSTSTLVIENPISFLANANPGDSQDIGIVGQYTSGTVKYAGVVRDSATKSFRFFDGLATKPTTTVSWSGTTAANVYMGSGLVANSTVSTSTTTGAFQVVGGVGIGGATYIGGTLNVSGLSTVAAVTASSTVQPSANATVNLGTSSTYWNNLYAAAITTNGMTVGGGKILPAANVSIDIGSTTAWFNKFYGVSTQAQYADLAENYQADSQYEPGTVVEFGGDAEVTIATDSTKRVAGVVSTNPAHLMNGGLSGKNVVPLALQGRVPCKVIGPVRKGDLMVSAGFGYAKANNDAATGQVIGKALADFSGAKGQIEVVVGRV